MASNLWLEVLFGQYDLAIQMISRGANVNEPRNTKYDPVTTLLHYVIARKSDVQCIRVLANLGANFNARDSCNRTPLHWAARYGAGPDVVAVLINNEAVVDARDDNEMTPLHYYVTKNNCIESVQKLLARGASLEAVGRNGQTMLHMAVWQHNLEMVKMLISYRVNVDTKDVEGFTPLLCYFSKRMKGEDTMEILQLLLDNGADVNAKADNTSFPLLLAANFNRLAPLHLLLKRGARVNEAIDIGYTALHVACKRGLADVTALLLEFGADLNARNCKGKTPFEVLRNSPSSEAIAQIIIREAVKREALGQFLCEGYEQMAQSCETHSKFEQECCEEVKRMQSKKVEIEDSAISFFYMLTIDEEKLAALARNEKIVKAFESSGYMESFRIYAGELTTKFEVAKKRANFLMRVEAILDDVLGGMFPTLIVQKIATYIEYDVIIENEL